MYGVPISHAVYELIVLSINTTSIQLVKVHYFYTVVYKLYAYSAMEIWIINGNL